MKNYFNIIIPTRERSETLFSTIKTCINQDYENLNIIISDNDSKDNTKEVVLSFNDKRIQYFNTGERLSMVQNFEHAISKVKHGYVASIGDDDALVFDAIVRANEILNLTGCKAISNDPAVYSWPSIDNKSGGLLKFSNRSDVEIRDSKFFLEKVLFGNLPYHQVPILYYGFIENQIIKSIKSKHGRIFTTNQVDISSAIIFSQYIENYAFTFEPLFIAGISNRSNGGSFFNSSSGNNEKENWHKENNFEAIYPFETVPNIRLLLAESHYQLSKEIAPSEMKVPLNLDLMLTLASIDATTTDPIINTLINKINKHFNHSGNIKKTNHIKHLIMKKVNMIFLFLKYNLFDTKNINIKSVYDATQFMKYYNYKSGVLEKIKVSYKILRKRI